MNALEKIAYADRGTALTGWLARPAGPARGGVVIFPTIVNANPHMERRAAMLAAMGFVAFIADFYGEEVADFAASAPLAQALRADVDHYRARLAAAVSALAGHAPDLRLSAIGYCMGGQAALELARAGADLDLVASFHGVFATDRPARGDAACKPRVLILHGEADPLAPRDHVLALWDEFDRAGYDWHFHAYSGVRHGFTDPESDLRDLDAVAYNASADHQSWAALGAMLDEIYP